MISFGVCRIFSLPFILIPRGDCVLASSVYTVALVYCTNSKMLEPSETPLGAYYKSIGDGHVDLRSRRKLS